MHHRLSLLARTPPSQPLASASAALLARSLVRRAQAATRRPTAPAHRTLASAADAAQPELKWDDHPPEPPITFRLDEAFAGAGVRPGAGAEARGPETDERAVAMWAREVDAAEDGFGDCEDDEGSDLGRREATDLVYKGKGPAGRAVNLPRADQPQPRPSSQQTNQQISSSSRPAKPKIVFTEDHTVSHPVTRSAEILANTLISPFVPAAAPADADKSLEPHQIPLTSRYDWRLSSPLRSQTRTRPDSPPTLWAHASTALQGHNRLVGVGVEPGRTARGGAQIRREEAWGWKIRVPENESGAWLSADAYRSRSVPSSAVGPRWRGVRVVGRAEPELTICCLSARRAGWIG